MSEHRESRTSGAGRTSVPAAWAVVTTRGARPGGIEWYVFEDGSMNPAALRARLDRLRPRPLKAQSSRTSRHETSSRGESGTIEASSPTSLPPLEDVDDDAGGVVQKHRRLAKRVSVGEAERR